MAPEEPSRAGVEREERRRGGSVETAVPRSETVRPSVGRAEVVRPEQPTAALVERVDVALQRLHEDATTYDQRRRRDHTRERRLVREVEAPHTRQSIDISRLEARPCCAPCPGKVHVRRRPGTADTGFGGAAQTCVRTPTPGQRERSRQAAGQRERRLPDTSSARGAPAQRGGMLPVAGFAERRRGPYCEVAGDELPGSARLPDDGAGEAAAVVEELALPLR